MPDDDGLAALSGQLDDLRANIARLRTTVANWDERLTEGIGEMMILRIEVKHLAEALDEALAKHRLKPPPAPYWRGLKPAEHRERLAELHSWVEEILRVHYPGYTSNLQACWVNHAEAVWELSTIRAEWLRVYGDEDNRDLAAALWWHERWLPGVLMRLAKAIPCDQAGCRLERRRESRS